MAYCFGIAVLLASISLTTCRKVVQEYSQVHITPKTYVNFPDASPACQEALTSCESPQIQPVDERDWLAHARGIELLQHCRGTHGALFCLQDLVGKNQCSDLNPDTVRSWKRDSWPILEDSWRYICNTQFDNFSIHYRCLLTEGVINGVKLNCSSANSAPEAYACFNRIIKEECGSTASKIASPLLKQFLEVDVVHERHYEYEVDDSPSEVDYLLPPGYAFQKRQTILKKLLNRK